MNPDEGKEPMSQETALEMALLFSILSASGRKDGKEYASNLVATFNQMLDGFGYKVVSK